MRPLVQATIRQTVFVNVVFVILTVAGVFSLLTAPLENMPKVDMGRVFIRTVWFGATADDIEQLVTREIEEAIDGLDSVEFIQSKSFRNYSSVEVKFIDDTDYRFLYDELRFRVLNIKDELPEGVDDPTFLYVDTYEWLPVIVVNLAGDFSNASLKLYADELKILLAGLPEVMEVEIEGEYEREFHVSADPARLRRFGVTFARLTEAIAEANVKLPTGRFRQADNQFMLDAGQRLRRQQDVLDVVVRRDGDGNFLRVRDLVTSARLSHRDPTLIPSVNGANALRLVVRKEERGNAVDVAADVKRVAREFEALHGGDGLRVAFTNDSTIEINDSIRTLGGNLVLGMGLVLLVLWVTLGFRNAMVTAIGIPFSFLCSLIIMKLTGVSLNTISLFAFVLVTGILVDDAVIIVENIYRHLQMGKPKKAAVVEGTAEVMLPVISSALTTILAFVPMLIMTGSTGEFFAVIPKTVAYALLASLLEALFILPIHALDWCPASPAGQAPVEETDDPSHHLRTGLFAPLWRLYAGLVRLILDHKGLTFGALTALLVATVAALVLSALGIVPLIQVEFFPGNYFRYHVTVENPAETAIEETDRRVRELSAFIMSLGPGQAQSAAGSAGYFEDQDYARHSGSNFGQIVVTLPEASARAFPDNPANDPLRHLEVMRARLAAFVQERYGNARHRPIVTVFEEADGPPTGKPVNIRVTAGDLAGAVAASDRLLDFMGRNPELAALIDLDDNRPDFHRTYQFHPRQEAAFEYGLAPGAVTAILAGALNGRPAGKFRSTDEEVDLLVRLARRTDPGNPEGLGLAAPLDVLAVPVIDRSDAPVLLGDLVTAVYADEPSVRTRYNGKPTLTITADIRPGTPLSTPRVQKVVSDFFRDRRQEFPGVTLSFGGEFESTSKSYVSLAFAFAIALLGIYMVLASQFNDYLQPVIILSAVPMALIGVVLGLLVTRTPFTVGSFMAVVGLTGLVVNDTLLLIDFMNKRRRRGRPLRAAVVEACAARMRPVLITTVTTLLGLLPMALGIPNKSIAWAPMATTFCAGLSSATLLTLLVTPANYELLESARGLYRRITGSASRGAPPEEPPGT